jgi:hypothetical protein
VQRHGGSVLNALHATTIQPPGQPLTLNGLPHTVPSATAPTHSPRITRLQ